MTSRNNGRWSRVSTGLWLVVLSLIVVGCSGISDQISGRGKYAPDEFSVVSRAPLTLPPDYGLRPPVPGALRPQESRAQDVAKAALQIDQLLALQRRRTIFRRPPIISLSSGFSAK